jgi:hypothetical protein
MKRGSSITVEKMQLQEQPVFKATDGMIYMDALSDSSTTAAGQTLVNVQGNDYTGYPYTMSYTFSTQYKRTQGQGGSLLTDTSGRLQLRQMTLLYEDTGRFSVTTTAHGVSHSYSFTGQPLGLLNLGVTALETGEFSFPIQSKNDHVSVVITNDTPYPSAFQSAEWTGFYTTKSRRI